MKKPEYEEEELSLKIIELEKQIVKCIEKQQSNNDIIVNFETHLHLLEDCNIKKSNLEINIQKIKDKNKKLKNKIEIQNKKIQKIDESSDLISSKLDKLEIKKDEQAKLNIEIDKLEIKIMNYKSNLDRFSLFTCSNNKVNWLQNNGKETCMCCKLNKDRYNIEKNKSEMEDKIKLVEILRSTVEGNKEIILDLEIFIVKKTTLEENKKIKEIIFNLENEFDRNSLDLDNKKFQLMTIDEKIKELMINKNKKEEAEKNILEIKIELTKLTKLKKDYKILIDKEKKYRSKKEGLSLDLKNIEGELLNSDQEMMVNSEIEIIQKIEKDYKLFEKIELSKERISELDVKIEKCLDYDPNIILNLKENIHAKVSEQDMERDIYYKLKTERDKYLEAELFLNKEIKKENIAKKLKEVLETYPDELRNKGLLKMRDEINNYIRFSGFNYTAELDWNKDKRCKKNLSIGYKNEKGENLAVISGGERFAFRLAVMHGLNQISNLNKSTVLFIDEGFVGWDEEHLRENLETILKHLKKYYKYIFSISHIESVQRRGDKTLKINKKGEISWELD